MNVLCIHQNFPGQYKHLAAALVTRGDRVTALALHENPVPAGVRCIRYPLLRNNTSGVHPWLLDTESKIIRAESCLHAARQLLREGYTPDVICAHPGWGESLLLKTLWPDVPMLGYFEFYYRAIGQDVGFDPEFPLQEGDIPRLQVKNLVHLMSLELCDAGVTPTVWQWNTHPPSLRHKLQVVHDGIDTNTLRPNPEAGFGLPGMATTLRPGDEIVTYVSRNLEPYRGYHSFIRALPEILRRRPRARILIVGGDGVSYGRRPPKGSSYRQRYVDEVSSALDFSRVHFLGRLPYPDFVTLLQVSAVHVYLTYPFILSWSMLEAMSCGCLVVGSATPPVEEVIRHGENGLLVNFFSPAEVAEHVVAVLESPKDFDGIRRQARQQMVSGYDLTTVSLPRHLACIDAVVQQGGKIPLANR